MSYTTTVRLKRLSNWVMHLTKAQTTFLKYAKKVDFCLIYIEIAILKKILKRLALKVSTTPNQLTPNPVPSENSNQTPNVA